MAPFKHLVLEIAKKYPLFESMPCYCKIDMRHLASNCSHTSRTVLLDS